MKRVNLKPGVSTFYRQDTGELKIHEFVGASTVSIQIEEEYEEIDRELAEEAQKICSGGGEAALKRARKKFKDDDIFNIVDGVMNRIMRNEDLERDEKGIPTGKRRKRRRFKLGKNGSLVPDLEKERNDKVKAPREKDDKDEIKKSREQFGKEIQAEQDARQKKRADRLEEVNEEALDKRIQREEERDKVEQQRFEEEEAQRLHREREERVRHEKVQRANVSSKAIQEAQQQKIMRESEKNVRSLQKIAASVNK